MRTTFIALLTAMLVATAAPVLAEDQVALFDGATGRWHVRFADATATSFFYGVPGDTPLLGDWDCDGTDTVAMYRESTGFIYLRNSNTTGVGEQEFFFGNPGDVPLAGDWDGDGCDTFAIYRSGEVFITNSLGTVQADDSYFFGIPGDRPFAGDFDGDGVDTVGLYRESTGLAYFRNSLSSGVADFEFFYGEPSDRIVAGDWDGVGGDSVGIFRPADGRFYLSNENRQGPADVTFDFGSGSWLPAAGRLGEGSGLPPLALETVASGFDRPLLATAAPGDDRLFVVEQGGRVWIVEDGTVDPTPFLDISAEVSGGNEQGLLGLEFHPDFGSNGVFYVSFTNTAGDSRVDEFTVTTDPRMGRPDTRRNLLAVSQPATNHNGGHLQIGPDGALYLGLGDGGGGGDPFGNGQNSSTLLGSMVRIDLDTDAATVWATGLRNPWRFDFDGSRIYIADVGQNAVEEVNITEAVPGRNYGWNRFEGSSCFGGPCGTAGLTFPVIEYSHTEGCSVTGGYVYRGSAIAGLEGAYLYSDFCSGFLRGVIYDGTLAAARDYTPEIGALGRVTSFGEDGSGELYVITIDGRVRKLVAG